MWASITPQSLHVVNSEPFISFRLRSRMHFVAKGSLTLKFESQHDWSLALDACMRNRSSQSWHSRSCGSVQWFLSHLHTFLGKVKFSEVSLVSLWWQEIQGIASDLCLESPDLLVCCFCCCSKPAWSMALGSCGTLLTLKVPLGKQDTSGNCFRRPNSSWRCYEQFAQFSWEGRGEVLKIVKNIQQAWSAPIAFFFSFSMASEIFVRLSSWSIGFFQNSLFFALNLAFISFLPTVYLEIAKLRMDPGQ